MAYVTDLLNVIVDFVMHGFCVKQTYMWVKWFMEEETRWIIFPVIFLLQIADTVFTEKKKTAKKLFTLWKDDYLHLEVNFISESSLSFFCLVDIDEVKNEELPRGRLSWSDNIVMSILLLFCVWVLLSCYRNK